MPVFHRLSAVAATSLLLASLNCAAIGSPASETPEAFPSRRGPDRLDVEYAKEIAAHTTDPAYLTPWVDHLPVSKRVPSPKQFLGYSIGTPGRLTSPEKINAYFLALAEASPRIEVFSMGRSHGGREMLVAALSSRKNLRKLDDTVTRNHELADPRKTDEARAREIAATTPPIYYMTAGLHSPETGPPEMVMELAYRLAVSDQKHIEEIRDEVIVMITPVLEMDGRARMVDWYKRYLTGLRTLNDMPPRMAPYWGDYTAHDNNRDGLQQTQPLTRNFTDTFHRYLPVVTLDLHESVPLLYVSTGTGPYNQSIDPITVTEWQWMASYEVSNATKMGLPGVWSWGFYTGWYPGYILWVSNNHNSNGRFYETFGNTSPDTFERELGRSKYAGVRINAKEWYRADPPGKTVRWSLRNNTNYMQTGVLSGLQLTARHGEELLFNFWRKGKNSIEAGRTQRPHAFLIPREGQRDLGAVHRLLELLELGRIEVHEARADGEYRGVEASVAVKSGDFIVRMDQPYRNYAKTLLLAQGFPKTAKSTPYDDVAWSLDLHLGVEVTPIDDPRVLELAAEELKALPALAPEVAPATRWIIDHHGQASLASLRWALSNAKISALTKAWQDHPAGSLVIEGVTPSELAKVTGSLHLAPVVLNALPDEPTVTVNAPRVALFHTWTYTQDSGWARYSLEQLGVEYTLIDKDDLRSGQLKQRFDVIIVPSQGGRGFKTIVHGIDRKWGPMPYTKTPDYPSHGIIDSSPDITGGMGFQGLGELQAFVESGGLLVGLGSGGVVASEGGIARHVHTERPGGSPGSHVSTRVLRPEHPVVWGYGESSWVFRGNLPIYGVRDWHRGSALMQFGHKSWAEAERDRDRATDVEVAPPELKALTSPSTAQETPKENPGKGKKGSRRTPKLVRSGIVKNTKGLDRKPALVDMPVGRGRVLLFSWNPLHRHQNEHDFGFVTNALLFFDDFPAVPSRDDMRGREAEIAF